MKVFERIKMFRNIKGWSQEYIANQLQISLNAYGNIERGETDVNLSRLEQLATLFEIELSELFNPTENTILNLGGTPQNNQWCHVNNSDKHELEKQILINEQLRKENEMLKEMMEFIKLNLTK
jgi:transcriptional regulator with XRE-family HTH domain